MNVVYFSMKEVSIQNEFIVAGMNEAGLAECIVRAVSSCHPHLHPVLYER